MQKNNSGCFTAAVTGFSRLFLLFAWIARPIAFDSVFKGSWFIPCLGILILPFTTLMYVILVTNSPANVWQGGIDWLWIILAFLVDVSSMAAAGVSNRDRIPQGYPGSIPPEPPAQPPAA